MFRTYWDCSPNSETNQNWLPTSCPPSGVRRGSPDLRPVVSSRVWKGLRRISGFATRFWKKLVTAALGIPLISHHRRPRNLHAERQRASQLAPGVVVEDD